MKQRLSDPLGQQARQSKAGNAVPTIRAAMKIIAANTPRLSRRSLDRDFQKKRPAACGWHSHKARPATIFDYSRALAQGDWCLGPALARGHVGRHRDLRVLDTSQVLYDVLAIGIP